ncbi:hypothetical protein [Winslowiella arboricola]|uniref:hypothetical protein n=1 Tax=Winslowiella arboricola TaxID=2978220 RepID=UPI00225DCF69|nr:hypothetical protein [Winslowiella arboricola]MCU5773028.1 hypothetical protein [Winslowiella arboricola]
MLDNKAHPILTSTYETTQDFVPEEHSIYIFGRSGEERSKHIDFVYKNMPNITFKEIFSESLYSFTSENGNDFYLRSEKSILEFIGLVEINQCIYIDITGLTHSVWARLIQVSLNQKYKVRVVYVEPDQYSRSTAPVEGQIYDLSEKIQGIAPLTGFATISDDSDKDFQFIPLLGFEGTRLSFISEQVQPNNENIIPIIGTPGFKPWYVFESYLGNRKFLLETEAWQHVRYAPANCPFSCFYLLEEIAKSHDTRRLKIGLIGTKPHALGAVLFSLTSENSIELIHDHPIRKASRTDGIARLMVYHISSLFDGVLPVYTVNNDANKIKISRLRK